MRPDVRAFVRDINRNIADDFYTASIAVFFERKPLLEKYVLQKFFFLCVSFYFIVR